MNSAVTSTELRLSSPENGSAAPGIAVDLLVRLWMPDQRKSGSEHEHAPPGLIEFIEDATSAGSGRILTGDGYFYIAGVQTASEALVLSRRLQLGVDGFRRRSGMTPVSVSVAIDLASPDAPPPHPVDANRAGRSSVQPSHEFISLLKLSRPAQVLLTNDLSRQITEMVGLPLRPFPGRFGVYEYLWTDPARLDLLQSDPQLGLEVVHPASAARSLQSAEPAPATSPAVTSAARPAATLGRSSVPFSEKEIGPPSGILKKFRSPMAVAIGAAALLALVIGGVILTRLSHARQPLPPQHASIALPLPTPVSRPALPPAASSPSATAENTSEHSEPTPAIAPRRAPASKQKVLPRNVPAASPRPAGDCADAPKYLRLAQVNREQGRLTDAKREFEKVLSCEPNNEDARRGLDRTLAALRE